MVYCIIYELKSTTKNYSEFYQTLKSFSAHSQFVTNGWFIRTEAGKKDELFEKLRSLLDTPDLLLITQTSLTEMSGWLPSSSVEWLQQNNY
ncbi:MAG: hypothetical protein ACK5KT_16530 [Dysgonomonas sp.]